jgi:outer membrane immunogenic protein
MKTFSIIAAAGVLALAAAPALAQPGEGMSPSLYGTLGYTNLDDNSDTSAISGRLGARVGKYFGVEGEVAGGVSTGQTHVYGGTADVRMRDQYAGYAVGYLPVAHNADLFARVGYGATDSKITGPIGGFDNYRAGVAYGAGGQYFFSGPNGIRADYTRMEYGPTVGDSNVWSLAYVRKF